MRSCCRSRRSGCRSHARTSVLPLLTSLFSLLTSLNFHDERILHLVAELAPHALRLQVLVNRFDAVLAADAARLVAAERRVEGQRAIGVDPDGPRLECA